MNHQQERQKREGRLWAMGLVSVLGASTAWSALPPFPAGSQPSVPQQSGPELIGPESIGVQSTATRPRDAEAGGGAAAQRGAPPADRPARPTPGAGGPGQGADTELDSQLQEIITQFGLDRPPVNRSTLPFIDAPLAQLGKKLFYSKSLGGQLDSACVSCHHPMLGGADGLSFSVGVDAIHPDLLGPGRRNQASTIEVPRNAPTVFNVGLWDTGLFWDSRVESLGKEPGTNGSVSGIRTPDSPLGVADTMAGGNLAAAQAAFPVTSAAEMKGESFEAGSTNADIRAHLAARFGNYGVGTGELAENEWLSAFQEAYGVDAAAESLITFDRIAEAIGEFERSMVFVDNAWFRYAAGDISALTTTQKRGALLFFTPSQLGGAGCAACHNGPLFSDGQHHVVAFPQFGPGKGDGNADDFGRHRETSASEDRYAFRTPSLLNIAETAPFGHAGTFGSLERVVRHYVDPSRSLEQFFEREEWCRLPQFRGVATCAQLFPESRANSQAALNQLAQQQASGASLLGDVRLNDQQVRDVAAFMGALTDPCVTIRDCLAPWIADEVADNPDGQVLIGVDRRGNPL